MPDNVFGLPAHPMLVHMPVIMIPLTLVLALAAALWAPGRRALSIGAFLAAGAGMMGAQFAVMSGESLEERVDESALIEQHAQLGETTRTIAIVVFIAAALYVLHVFGNRAPGPLGSLGGRLQSPAVGLAVMAALVLSSALCTVWAVRTGHAGAKSAWGDLPAASQSGGEHGEQGDGD